ncbi:MAG TPA: PIN domain-containing protein [Patescibacteria group bacterium]
MIESQQDLLFLSIALAVAVCAYFIFRRLLHVSFPYFFLGLVGLITGLIIGSLVSGLLDGLPGNFGRWLPIIVNVIIAVGIFDLFLAQAQSATDFLRVILKRDEKSNSFDVVLDTSVLIDGRIEQIVETGFIPGTLIVPQVVLQELQKLADARDPMKRAKGKRGLNILASLRNQPRVKITIVQEPKAEETVDAELIRISQKHNAHLLTLDYNLNQIAHIRGVRVLNINALASALRPVLLPGESLMVAIIQKGKEPGQGLGYLPDGTMIIVEGGDTLVDHEVECEVVRIYQTVSGKIVFVAPKGSKKEKSRANLKD